LRWGYTRYNVKVTVTNVGSEPLGLVWIFLFPYVDGKLEVYRKHSVENLYIGETYSKTFTWYALPNEMISYKVFAVAGGG